MASLLADQPGNFTLAVARVGDQVSACRSGVTAESVADPGYLSRSATSQPNSAGTDLDQPRTGGQSVQHLALDGQRVRPGHVDQHCGGRLGPSGLGQPVEGDRNRPGAGLPGCSASSPVKASSARRPVANSQHDDRHLGLLVGGEAADRLAEPGRGRDDRDQQPVEAERGDGAEVGWWRRDRRPPPRAAAEWPRLACPSSPGNGDGARSRRWSTAPTVPATDSGVTAGAVPDRRTWFRRWQGGRMPAVDTVLLPLCVGLTLLGVIVTGVAWRRGNKGRVVQGVGLALAPIALYFSGLLRLLWDGVVALGSWASQIIFSPAVWFGLSALGLCVVLWVVGGIVGSGSRAPRRRHPAAKDSGAAPCRYRPGRRVRRVRRHRSIRDWPRSRHCSSPAESSDRAKICRSAR